MYISGGRNANGEVLSDVWMITSCSNIDITITDTIKTNISTHETAAVLLPPPANSSSKNEKKTEALIYELTSSQCPEDTGSARITINPINCDYAPSKAISHSSDDNSLPSPPPCAIQSVAPLDNSMILSPASTKSPLQWKRCLDMELDIPRCAHGSAILATSPVNSESSLEYFMVLFGGFTGEGVSSDYSLYRLPPSTTTSHQTSPQSGSVWTHPSCSNGPKGRFGLAMSSISAKLLKSLQQNKRYGPVFSSPARHCAESWDSATTEEQLHAGAVIFGGVSVEQDFGDIWLLMLS